MTKQKITYNEAVVELDAILADLEHNELVDMDVIGQKVKRAAVLIDFCRKELHVLDKDLEKVLEGLADS